MSQAKFCLLISISISFVSGFQHSFPTRSISHRLPLLDTPYQVSKGRSSAALWTATPVIANNEGESDESIHHAKRKLTTEFISIGLPAFIQLAAEPLAALVDTAYLGRLGPEGELGTSCSMIENGIQFSNQSISCLKFLEVLELQFLLNMPCPSYTTILC